jgi:predicted nucleic acid-binding protein
LRAFFVIVDTSAVIEFLRGTGSSVHLLLARRLHSAQALYLPSVVLQEVLQGARNASEFVRLQSQMDHLPLFEPENVHELHRQAALLYARCRWQGLTVRSPMDCVVAACALEADMPLLARDRDFAAIAQIEPQLKLIS